jgi:large subunit ribosomal protein L25
MTDVVLAAEPRTQKGSANAGRLRRAGKLPAVVYGLDAETLTVTVSARELDHALHSESGANTLITLQLDGDETLALARQIQRHPTRNELVHVDFVRVRRDVAVAAEVPLTVEGEPPGAKEGGMLEQVLFTLSVEAMPGNIPTSIAVDVSGVPPGVDVQHEADELVAQVSVPRGIEEEEEAAEGEEGEEGEEGAVAEGEEGAPEAAASGGDGGGESSEE